MTSRCVQDTIVSGRITRLFGHARFTAGTQDNLTALVSRTSLRTSAVTNRFSTICRLDQTSPAPLGGMEYSGPAVARLQKHGFRRHNA